MGTSLAPTGPNGAVTALVHDYLTQRGGAERVVLALERAFTGAPVYTSLYQPDDTFPEFEGLDVRTLPIDKISLLRRRHRLALPALGPAFSHLTVPADVTVCSSSGWAHGARTEGRKVVYCHAPARWLYQQDRYLGNGGWIGRLALNVLRGRLERWDRRAAATADRYIANSTETARQIQRVYGIEAEVIHPPIAIQSTAAQTSVAGVEPGYLLCVSRLLAYKNIEPMIAAFATLPGEQLVIVGEGPERESSSASAGPNVRLLGAVDDAQLRWLYAHSTGLIAASYEDFGLTPLEAAAFGKPTVALRFGGFVETVIEGESGVFFDTPSAAAIAAAVAELRRLSWNEATLIEHAASFSERRFGERMRGVVDAELAAVR